MKSVPSIEINLDPFQDGLRLFLDARTPDTLFDGEETAEVNNEARFQLLEGYFYNYTINSDCFVLGNIGENIIQQHKRIPKVGIIAPNIFV